MKIEDLQALENKLNEPGGPISDSLKTAIWENLTYEESKKQALEDSFNWFYTDVIERALQFDFKRALGDVVYEGASEDAKTCLLMSLEVRKIPPALINSWLSAALKVIDNIVIHYIQDCLKIPFESYPSLGEETSRYRQLAHQENPIGEAGTKLENLYSIYRNTYEHRTKREKETGRLIIERGNLVWRQREIIKYLKSVMLGLLSSYKQKYPSFVTQM